MRFVLALLCIANACSLCGCRAIEDTRSESALSQKNELPSIKSAPNAIELEIGHITRFAADPLVNEDLWREINQVIAGDDDEIRHRIRENGFRVGIAAAQPPNSLVKLLQPSSAAASVSEQSQQIRMNSVLIPDGAPTQITASPHFKHCRISFPARNEPEVQEYDFAQGEYRLTTGKQQDGWVELEFTPVIQHAAPKFRHTATQDGTFAMNNGQKQKVFHTNRFKVRVMVGEWVVIGADPDRPGTLGHQFYFGSEADDLELQAYRKMLEEHESNPDKAAEDAQQELHSAPEPQFQRLLVVRVANIKSAVVQ